MAGSVDAGSVDGGLVLRRVRAEDEADVVAARAELAAEGGTWSYLDDAHLPFAEHVARVHGWERGEGVPSDWVPVLELVADVGGTVVGRASLRLELNEFLSTLGGHLGYTVRPAFRGRGHATEILRQGLTVLRARGITPVLVTCDEDNLASRRVIEKVGGRFEGLARREPPALPRRRYWFD